MADQKKYPAQPFTELRERAEALARDGVSATPDSTPVTPDGVRRLDHELEVHRIELLMQNEELREAQRALELTSTRYAALFECSPVGHFILDTKGRILQVNPAGAEMLGQTRASLLSRRLSGWLQQSSQDHFFLHLRRCFHAEPNERCEVEFIGPDGSTGTALVESTLLAATDQAAAECLTVMVDISERKAAQQALQTLAAELEQRVAQRTADLAEANRTLAERAAEIADLYDHAPCGYHSIGPDGVILKVNQTELDMLGYRREELVGQPVTAFMTPASQALVQRTLPDFLRRDGQIELELEFTRRDGQVLPVLVVANWMHDAEGRPHHTRTTLFDRSEHKARAEQIERMQAELEQRARAADAASLAKSQFLASMSHELRTPLNSLLILAQLLIEDREHRLGAEQIRYATIIHRSGSDLLVMINDLLDLAKIEAGHQVIDSAPVELVGLAGALDQSLRHVAQDKGLQFSVELAPDLPAQLETDGTRLLQVLRNLLSNAIKFTPAGRVGLRIERASQGRLAFIVSDSGIGIAPEHQELIFEAFRQADAGTSRSYGGTGLGLAISRELTSLLGGELTLRSSIGSGSTFTLFLPLLRPTGRAAQRRPTGAAAVLQAPSGPTSVRVLSPMPPPDAAGHLPAVEAGAEVRVDPALAGRQVLLVDDDIRNLFALTALLEHRQLQVLTASSGAEALALLPQHPDVAAVLLDVMMPGMDGLEVTRRLRAQASYRELPIIALTAKAMKGAREECLAAGCSDYLSKPVDIHRLLAVLREWICR